MRVQHLMGVLVLALSIPAHALDEASQALNEWRPDLALQHLDARVHEDDARWHRLKGAALISVGESDEGFNHLERALELAPDDAENHWYYLMGLTSQLDDSGLFSQLRLARQIRNTMETAVELDPDNPEYRFGLMQYYIGAPGVAGGSQRKARGQRDVMAKIDPLWGHAADALFLLDDGEAEAGLEKMRLAWNNGDGVEQIAMSIVFNAQGLEDWDMARTTLDQYLTRKPGHPYALYQLGRTAALSGEHLEAGLEALERYVDLPYIAPSNPPRAAALWRIGQLHLHAGDPDKARLAWLQSLELDPDFEDAQQALSELESSERDEATSHEQS